LVSQGGIHSSSLGTSSVKGDPPKVAFDFDDAGKNSIELEPIRSTFFHGLARLPLFDHTQVFSE
jgi:hypothetical protein